METRGPLILPVAVDLRTHLRTAQPTVAFRVEGLQPEGSRVVLSAQYRAGKTTAVGNLVRTLGGGGDFLGHHRVTPAPCCVAIFDAEMSEGQGLDWLRGQQFAHDERVFPFLLRDRWSPLAFTDTSTRDAWATLPADRMCRTSCWIACGPCWMPSASVNAAKPARV